MTTNEIPTGYYLRTSRTGVYLVDGPRDWKYVGLRGGTREQAIAAIHAHAAAPAPAAQPAVQAPTTSPMPAGWSNAAKRRAGQPATRDAVGDYMAGSFGLRSPAPAGTCHYCGLSTRTHDCY